MTDIATPIIDAMPYIEETFDVIFDGLKFRGKTVQEWEQFLMLPPISENPAPAELSKFNIKYIEINEAIMMNYAYAKSASTLSNATYQYALKTKQDEILNKMQKDNKKIGVELLAQLAASKCLTEYHASKIHELFVDFWKIYYDKMSLLDSRLSNLSFLIRN